jgi:hypothetical protein
MIGSQAVEQFVHAALECSIYAAPRDFGLTFVELKEAGSRAGFKEGELGEAVRNTVCNRGKTPGTPTDSLSAPLGGRGPG